MRRAITMILGLTAATWLTCAQADVAVLAVRLGANDVVAVIGSNPLEPADGDRLLLDATPPASRLAGAVAYATENSREDIRVAIHHVGLGKEALCDQADVLRNIGVSRTSPLAINDSMVVVGIRSISWFHSKRGRRRAPS